MRSFEDSIAWQKAMDLNEAVDIALEGSRNFGFKDQLFRASLSICNNIAEGHEMPTTRHQVHYLWIAKGSCNEVCSMLILAKRRGYFTQEQVEHMLSLQDEVGRLLRTYIKNKTGKWGKMPGLVPLMLFWAKLTLPL
ncbi:MAG: four helix bundle protein [Flavobacteriales bacterium]|jgi:four helix bundle protein|nr:four helix bundle protein [Flavobacteriales bacterium]